MKILILGGAGFLGKKLTLKLLEKNSLDAHHPPIERILIFDRIPAKGLSGDNRVKICTGDLANLSEIESLIGEKPDLIFHLAAIVSGEAEKDFNLGMRINFLASYHLLEACRKASHTPRVIFSSSCAVFGGNLPEVVNDRIAVTPQSSYGTQKAVIELLINDYSRRQFISGCALRLPTVVVRPGKPNAATSSFASGIIREPLNGKMAICPVSKNTKLWISSPETVVQNLIFAAQRSQHEWGDNRILSLPGITVSVEDMVSSLASVGGSHLREMIKWQPNTFIENIVSTWPASFEVERALQLGFYADQHFDQIVQSYIDNELD